ncbi:acid-shock protein [Aminobacter sp. BA135]|uniref:EF-hand domain-containing protein n=1 Tax=Aminobacter sp. BA135 TaxID=537596 RepID=UPI003D793835
MNTSTRIAIAFLALAGTAGTSAFAANGQGPRGQNMKPEMRFEKADADKSGDVTFEEFAAAMNNRLLDADENTDGKITVAEVADQIQRMRAERMAKRLIKRFDANGDGELTKAEIEGRQKKLFALLDRNDDGKIVKDEMPVRNWHGGNGKR